LEIAPGHGRWTQFLQRLCQSLVAVDISEKCVEHCKTRFADRRRGKGKRGGLRVIYYWWSAGMQFWLYTLYDKDEMADMTAKQRKVLKTMLKAELDARRAT